MSKKHPTVYELIENKELWPDGPWKEEPDYKEFEYRGIKCFIKRGPEGQLNGYIGFPTEDISEDIINSLEVHGGLTFDEIDKSKSYRLIGFDCGHIYDITPIELIHEEVMEKEGYFEKKLVELSQNDNKLKEEMRDLRKRLKEKKTYKDINFVEKEIKSMVSDEQAANRYKNNQWKQGIETLLKIAVAIQYIQRLKGQ